MKPPPHLAGQKRARAFTRLGANQLSTVLKSKVAAQRSVQIMRAFSALEETGQRAGGDIDAMLEGLFGPGFMQSAKQPAPANVIPNLQAQLIETQAKLIRALERPATVFGQRKAWTPEEKAFVIEKRRQGWGARRIARPLGRSMDSVANMLRRLSGGAA